MKPNVFLIGFPKSGTTSIYNSLATHPQVLAPQRKEPGDWENLSNLDGHGSHEYLMLYATTSEFQVAIDGTTRYSLNPLAATKIKQFSPNAKIIIGIREPLAYLYSMAFQIEKNTGIERNLEEDLESERTTKWTHPEYVEVVNSFFNEFGREDVLVFTHDELKINQKDLLKRLSIFLDLDTQTPFDEIVSNVSKRYKSGMHEFMYKAFFLSDLSISLRSRLKKSSFLRERLFPALRKKIEDASYEVGGVRKRLPPALEKAYRESYRNEVAELSNLLGIDLASLWSGKEFSYVSKDVSQTGP